MAIEAIEYIEKTPGICGGAPRIAGRRTRVSEIAVWHIRNNISVLETAKRLDLTLAQVYAALSYYYDHAAEIEAELMQERTLVTETQATQSGQ